MKFLRLFCDLIKRTYWDGDPTTLERWFSVCGLALGTAVMLPYESTSPPFTLLGRLVPEAILGALLFGMGFVQLYATYRENLCANLISSMMGIGIWGWFAYNCLTTEWRGLIWILYFLMAGAWAIIFFKQPLEPLDKFMEYFGRFRWAGFIRARLQKAQAEEIFTGMIR